MLFADERGTAMKRTLLPLAISWASVLAFFLFGNMWLADFTSPLLAFAVFVWLLGAIVVSAFAVVHEAEELAHLLGEPLGTLILTLSIVIIEVALISAVMLGAKDAPTLARDTMFAVLMIVLNGVVGLGLLIGGLRHHEQTYNLQGAAAYLAILVPLTLIALVLPNFTTSTSDGTLTVTQGLFFSAFTILLYGLFLVLQTGRHRGFFIGPNLDEGKHIAGAALPPDQIATGAAVGKHVALLLANILPIVILAKGLAGVLEYGIAALGAPVALGGILIAMIVFTPEGISALRAILADDLQRAVNLCLGAAASTLGLTIPAVVMIGLFTGKTVILGLSSINMVLLAMTLFVSAITFSNIRTTMLEGAVHLTIFLVFLTLVFSP
jgi:Ca2+:H+ antiporter